MQVGFIDEVHPVLAERLIAAGHECHDLSSLAPNDLWPALEAIEGIVVRSKQLTGENLARLPHLKFIGRVGSGLENIDRTWCEAHNVLVMNSPEGNRDGVGEMAVALLLVMLKSISTADRAVRDGRWEREVNRGAELTGRTVGIIGFGQMGSAFAEKLAGFGTRILAYDKYVQHFGNDRVKESTLEELQASCDVISVHLPLNEETTHYINEAFIKRMKRPFWLLNTSRGPIVETEAILDALDQGRVLGAGLDVIEFERPDLSGLDMESGGSVLRRLLAHDRVVLTPHVAGVTHEGKLKMASILADKIINAHRNGLI